MIHRKLDEIEEIIGFSFNDRELITRAFVHASYAHEHGVLSYENLEFLGDGILQSVISVYLYNYLGENPSSHSEGLLTGIRSAIVKKEPLIKAVLSMGLDRFILTGNGLKLTDNEKKTSKIISDIFESVLGAIYIEKGYEAAREFALKNLSDQIKKAFSTPSDNYKGQFQEYVMKNKLGDIVYNTNPEGNGFVSEIILSGRVIALGQGKTKKEAETAAAEKALKALKI